MIPVGESPAEAPMRIASPNNPLWCLSSRREGKTVGHFNHLSPRPSLFHRVPYPSDLHTARSPQSISCHIEYFPINSYQGQWSRSSFSESSSDVATIRLPFLPTSPDLRSGRHTIKYSCGRLHPREAPHQVDSVGTPRNVSWLFSTLWGPYE